MTLKPLSRGAARENRKGAPACGERDDAGSNVDLQGIKGLGGKAHMRPSD